MRSRVRVSGHLSLRRYDSARIVTSERHVGYPCLVGNTVLCIADNSCETVSYGVVTFMLLVCNETELIYGAFRPRTYSIASDSLKNI